MVIIDARYRVCATVPTYIQVVDGQEGFGFTMLLLNERNTVASHFLCSHYQSVHVAAKHLGDGQLVLLMDGTAQVRESTILGQVSKTGSESFPQTRKK